MRKYWRIEPLEVWHCFLCGLLGIWILMCGYSTYDLRLYASLLAYLSPIFFSGLFLGFALGGAFGICRQWRMLRHVLAGVAAVLWGFTGTFYLVNYLHPIGFVACAVFALQQIFVFIGTRK
jgi:hypothetical protein